MGAAPRLLDPRYVRQAGGGARKTSGGAKLPRSYRGSRYGNCFTYEEPIREEHDVVDVDFRLVRSQFAVRANNVLKRLKKEFCKKTSFTNRSGHCLDVSTQVQ